MLALGDRAYVNFCSTGRTFDERFAALGGHRLAPMLECDVDYAAPASAWIKSTLDLLKKETESDEGAVIHVDFARSVAAAAAEDDEDAEPAYTRDRPFEAAINELINSAPGARSATIAAASRASLRAAIAAAAVRMRDGLCPRAAVTTGATVCSPLFPLRPSFEEL